jgi:O-acetyl-ADP-ribose deacetylase (regulator of RNase III)
MIIPAKGDLLRARAEALVNAVNTVGVMGKGIALQFKQTYPAMFSAYHAACSVKEVMPGRMHVFDIGAASNPPRWIINFPTKRHWRDASLIEDIDSGLSDLARVVRELDIKSIAIPPLGCGLGGLPWPAVRTRIETAFAPLPDVEVLLFSPIN